MTAVSALGTKNLAVYATDFSHLSAICVSPFQYAYWCRQNRHVKSRNCTSTRQYS